MKKKISIIFLCLLLAFESFTMHQGNWTESRVYAGNTSASFSPSTSTVMSAVRKYMLAQDTNPDFSSIWNVFDLERSGLEVPSDYQNTFYKNVITYLNNNNWKITSSKYTEYSKLILAMTSLGKNAQNLEGHNLFYYLSDFSNVKKQGFNGPIWALIALNCHPSYKIPTNSSAQVQTTEEVLINYLLDGEISGGGWALSGDEADTDITAMTIQALAPYYGVKGKENVTAAIDRALSWLSDNQYKSGGYGTTYGGTTLETSESVSQVIVALSELGIDCTSDSRFINNGNSPMNGLYQYYLSEGGFLHVFPASGVAKTINGLATVQGMYATIAYQRMKDGETSLYDMSDVTVSPSGCADESQYDKSDDSGSDSSDDSDSGSSDKKDASGGGSTITVKVSSVSLNYSQIRLTIGMKRSLSATILPTNASNQKIKWKSSNSKIAKVTSKGVVQGVKAGTAKITASATDGSKEKAVCTVIVVNTGTNTTTKTAGGTTKSLQSARGSGNSGTGNGDASGDGTQEGWSFDGDAYVPENSDGAAAEGNSQSANGQGKDTSDDGSWLHKTATVTIPIGEISYMLLGMLLLAAIELLVWWIRKRRKSSKTGGDNHEIQ